MDMHDCLDMCAETLEMRAYLVALEATTYILIAGVKLASHADSSSGMLTDVIMDWYLIKQNNLHKIIDLYRMLNGVIIWEDSNFNI